MLLLTIEQTAFVLSIGCTVGVISAVGAGIHVMRKGAGKQMPTLKPLDMLRLIIDTCPTQILELDRIFWRLMWGLWIAWPGTSVFKTAPLVYSWMVGMPEWAWGAISIAIGLWLLIALLLLQCDKCRRVAVRALMVFDAFLFLGFLFNGVATPAIVYYLREAMGSAWIFSRLAERKVVNAGTRDDRVGYVGKGVAWRRVADSRTGTVQK